MGERAVDIRKEALASFIELLPPDIRHLALNRLDDLVSAWEREVGETLRAHASLITARRAVELARGELTP